MDQTDNKDAEQISSVMSPTFFLDKAIQKVDLQLEDLVISEERLNRSEEAENLANENIFIFETVASQSLIPTLSFYRFTQNALESMARQYRLGKPILINHNRTGMLPVGDTINAQVVDNQLVVQAYFRRDWQAPMISMEQVAQGMIDGAINSVSLSIQLMDASCNICGQQIKQGGCMHMFMLGQEFEVTDPNNETRTETALIEVNNGIVLELSIVAVPADPTAQIIAVDPVENNLDTEVFDMAAPKLDELQQQLKSAEAEVQERKAAADNATKLAETQEKTITTLNQSVESLTTTNQELTKKVEELELSVEENVKLKGQLEEVFNLERSKALDCFKAAEPDATEEAIKEQQEMLATITSLSMIQTFARAWDSVSSVRNTGSKLPSGRQTKDSAGNNSADATIIRARGNARRY